LKRGIKFFVVILALKKKPDESIGHTIVIAIKRLENFFIDLYENFSSEKIVPGIFPLIIIPGCSFS